MAAVPNKHPKSVPAPFFEQLYIDTLDLKDTNHNDTTTPSTTTANNKNTPPKTLIVGGSMAGCCAAIALSSINCPVQVFESASFLRSQGAGLVIQPDMDAFLQHYHVAKPEHVSVPSTGRQYVDITGKRIGGDDNPQLFSAWDVLYQALRKRVPDTVYHSSSKITHIDIGQILPTQDTTTSNLNTEKVKGEEGVVVTTADGQQHTGELLLGCDGSGSLVRTTCSSTNETDVGGESEYQGYVAWRGLAPEGDVPRHVLEFLGRKFTVFQGANFHILAYLIPGEGGEVTEGKRRVNWVWYWNTEQSDLERILTDKNGKLHGFSVPRGLLQDEVAEETKQLARQHLPPQLAALVNATKDIFVQTIHDMLSSKLTFNGRVALLGDAGCILRPHTAAGTTKAAVNAWTLAQCLETSGFDVGVALKQYEEKMMPLARYLVDVGVSIGAKSQFPER